MSIYKLYGAGVTDSIASLDIVSNGKITGISYSITADLDLDLETSAVELSFSSANGFTTNDTKSSIATWRGLASDTGTAATNKRNDINGFMGPLNIPVKQGERLYLHGSGTAVTAATVYLYVEDQVSGGRALGRRVRL